MAAERQDATTAAEIAARRLAAQQIARPKLGTPGELVAALGAVQAQDPAAARWAVGLRLRGHGGAAVRLPAVEQAIDDGIDGDPVGFGAVAQQDAVAERRVDQRQEVLGGDVEPAALVAAQKAAGDKGYGYEFTPDPAGVHPQQPTFPPMTKGERLAPQRIQAVMRSHSARVVACAETPERARPLAFGLYEQKGKPPW